MWYFTETESLLAHYRHLEEQCRGVAERKALIADRYERKAELQPFERVNLESTMRTMGGITFLRMEIRSERSAANTWRQAAEMLEGLMRGMESCEARETEANHG